mgnify:CR=1 FL=1
MSDASPLVVVVAGPNGAGKSTSAPRLLRDACAVSEFVNADAIAQGLSAFHPEGVAFHAGRTMLERIRLLARERATFAFETTLATRSFAPWLTSLRRSGYRSHMFFLWLPSEELALARVAARVRMGGHDVPEDVVRRRFRRGLRNLLGLYAGIVDTWQVLDNSEPAGPRLVASGRRGHEPEIVDRAAWQAVTEHQR